MRDNINIIIAKINIFIITINIIIINYFAQSKSNQAGSIMYSEIISISERVPEYCWIQFVQKWPVPRARLAIAIEPILHPQFSLSLTLGRSCEDRTVVFGDLFTCADCANSANDHGGTDEISLCLNFFSLVCLVNNNSLTTLRQRINLLFTELRRDCTSDSASLL